MRHMLLLATAFAALATAASAAQTPAPSPPPPPGAQPGGPPPPGERPFARRFRGPGGPGPDRFFQRITPEERTKRRADLFAKMDANKNGQVTFEEYRAFIEAERLARQKTQFERFSGGQSAVTLDQLNARALERERDLRQRFEERRGRRGPPGPPPAPGPL